MHSELPCESLILIAGKGAYPRLLADSARRQGVKRIEVIAFKGETDRALAKYADRIHWLRLGQLDRILDALKSTNIHHAAMAGLITPTSLFNLRMDRAMFRALRSLREKNAHTLFGAVCDKLTELGIQPLQASVFMEPHMPDVGVLTRRQPDEREREDMRFGLKVAEKVSALDIGQTLVVKDGTVLAVEAFEGTDRTVRRAGRLGGRGGVVVKVAKPGHDMRFDIPVLGMSSLKALRKARVSAVAVQARRCIVLEMKKVLDRADRLGLAIEAFEYEESR